MRGLGRLFICHAQLLLLGSMIKQNARARSLPLSTTVRVITGHNDSPPRPRRTKCRFHLPIFSGAHRSIARKTLFFIYYQQVM